MRLDSKGNVHKAAAIDRFEKAVRYMPDSDCIGKKKSARPQCRQRILQIRFQSRLWAPRAKLEWTSAQRVLAYKNREYMIFRLRLISRCISVEDVTSQIERQK